MFCLLISVLYSLLFFISVTLVRYYLPVSDVEFNGGTLESDCNTAAATNNLLRLCPIPSRLADNVTEEGQEFDSFVRFRDDFELVFQFPDSRISLVDIHFYNNPGMGYGLPPVTEAGFSFNSLINFEPVQVSFANNSHLSQSDDSVTVVSIVVSSDPFDTPYSFLHLSFDNSSTLLSETYISEVKLFNGTSMFCGSFSTICSVIIVKIRLIKTLIAIMINNCISATCNYSHPSILPQMYLGLCLCSI